MKFFTNLFKACVVICALALGAQAHAALTITPITWDVVGLDHNRPLTSGPELFPVGARVCSDVLTSDVNVSMVWGDSSDATYIKNRPGSLTTLTFPPMGAGDCVDAYFEIQLTRTGTPFDRRSRPYTIMATDGTSTASTPAGRQIYIERLVSQNRNSTTQIRYGQQEDESDWVVLGGGGSINLAVNQTYFIELTTQTSTAYEQLQSFLTLSNTIFQVLSVSTTYGTLTAPDTRVLIPTHPQLWADGCLWDSNPSSPNYNSCLSTGKAGGVVTTVYQIRIISGGGENVGLEALIYDRSGGSFHYNTDFSKSPGDLVTFDPADSGFAKRFVPDTIGPPPATARLRFTITNPNPIDIAGYNFSDTLPSGVLVAPSPNVTTTCGGTVTAVASSTQIALANGTISANGSCTILVDVRATAAGTYNNVSGNLFIGDTDTSNNATATLIVSSTPPPVLVCDSTATLALWTFPTGSSATNPSPSSGTQVTTASAASGVIPANLEIHNRTRTTDGTQSWLARQLTENATLATAIGNNEYFQFTIDTTGLDSIDLSFSGFRRQPQGATNYQVYYGTAGQHSAEADGNLALIQQNQWSDLSPITLSTHLNPSGNTVFRIYVYGATGNQANNRDAIIDDVRFRGLNCQEVTPPPPTPGVNPPTIIKSFSPTPIGVGHESMLTFTITNPNATALSGIAFTDELPFGVSAVGTFGGTCAGFWNTPPGENSVLVHSGGSLAANASCTLTVNVTTTTVGTALNISEPIYATESGYNNTSTGTAQDELVVLASPNIAKSFDPDLLLLGVTPGNASTLTFTITNPNPNHAISGVSFSDTFPANLVVANPASATTSGCGSPTWAPTAGTGSVSFSGGSIAAGGACTVTVNVTGPAGVYNNVSSAVSHLVNGNSATNGNTASATLVIDQPIPGISILKQVGLTTNLEGAWFTNMVVPPGTSIYYLIIVENTGEVPLSPVTVSDPTVSLTGCTWTDPLPVASAANDDHITSCIVGPVTALQGTHTNTATATGTFNSANYTDSSQAQYTGEQPTAVVMGQVGLDYVNVTDFLRGIGALDLDAAGLLALLRAWDPALAAALEGTGQAALLAALRDYLDPDGDGRVVLFRWETLEERGTIGFYAERREGSLWTPINADLLPGLIAAPMGAEYWLADPGAAPGETYQYRLIETEATGTTREYGPFDLRVGNATQ